MKQEIWSTVMETHHPDHREWWLPSWVEPPHGPKDGDRIKEYPLTATTDRRIPVYFHSEHRQLPWCRELWPVPRIEINPKTAAEYGIEQGDWVWIETEWGKIARLPTCITAWPKTSSTSSTPGGTPRCKTPDTASSSPGQPADRTTTRKTRIPEARTCAPIR